MSKNRNFWILSHDSQAMAGLIQASSCKIQGLLNNIPTVFKDWKLMKNTGLHVKMLKLLLKC